MNSLIVWTAPLLALMAIAAMTWSLLRLGSEQATCRRQRQAIELSWQGYLESLSHRMRALRSLRAVLAQIRPYPEENELKALVQKLYDDVRDEIERVDNELERMANADDGQWYTERAEWDGGTDFHTQIQNLLVLARKHYESQDLEAVKDGVRSRVAADYDSRSAELEAKLQALQSELDEARAKLQAAEKAEPEGVEKEVRVDGEISGEEEMAIAARYMGGLTDNEGLEEADAKVSAAKGRLAHAEKQATETEDPTEKEKYRAEAAWEKQCLRWWEMIHTVRRQRRLLDEATGKASELSELGLDLDFEGAQEFQEMEARTKEMRNRIANLTNENKNLSEQLERFSLEQATAGELRDTLNRVDQARRNAERELSSVEAMIEQMEDEIGVLRRQLHEEKQKENISETLREERDRANEK
ncbi:MAG: hypothetical protein ACOC29_02535, partial [Candidatus Sumerlaeota bacterium]